MTNFFAVSWALGGGGETPPPSAHPWGKGLSSRIALFNEKQNRKTMTDSDQKRSNKALHQELQQLHKIFSHQKGHSGF